MSDDDFHDHGAPAAPAAPAVEPQKTTRFAVEPQKTTRFAVEVEEEAAEREARPRPTKAMSRARSIPFMSQRPQVPRGYSVAAGLDTDPMHEPTFWEKIFMGGSTFDGFLLAASQEVGQSILTLPQVFAMLGYAWGLCVQLLFATLALYTNWLLVTMHAQHRHNLKVNDDPKHHDPYHVVAYHEIMEAMVGPWLKWFSLGVVLFSLIGLTTVQIIAVASNCYILSAAVDKRTWSIIWGLIFSLFAFVPSFRHYRALAFLGIVTTTYVAWFMTISASIMGPQPGVTHSAPQDVESYFKGFVQLLFMYGGHTSNVEVADVMDNPAAYDTCYFWSYVYVFSLTMPNAVAGYYAFGDYALGNANSFAYFPRSIARDFGIVMMALHQAVAFGLFIGPLFHLWEKMIHVHEKPFKIRCWARLPICGFILFLSVAFPFFGAVNAILGAFTTSFGTYIIPSIAYNLAFKNTDVDELVKQPAPWVSMKYVKMFNWVVAIFTLVTGVGIGGYAAIKNFVQKLADFDYFAACYQCGNPMSMEEVDGFA